MNRTCQNVDKDNHENPKQYINLVNQILLSRKFGYLIPNNWLELDLKQHNYTLRFYIDLSNMSIYEFQVKNIDMKKEIEKMSNHWVCCVHKLPHIRYIDLISDICLTLIFLYNDFLYFDNEFNRCTFKCLQAKRNWAGLYLLLLSDNASILVCPNQKYI